MTTTQRQMFARLHEATVEVATRDHGDVPLRVDRIEDYDEADGTRFSVFFSGPAGQPLGQGTYEVRAGGETFPLFLVPVAREGERLSYEAAFNRSGTV